MAMNFVLFCLVAAVAVECKPLFYGAQLVQEDAKTPFAMQLFQSISTKGEGSGNGAQNFIYSPVALIRAWDSLKKYAEKQIFGSSHFPDETIEEATRLIDHMTSENSNERKSEFMARDFVSGMKIMNDVMFEPYWKNGFKEADTSAQNFYVDETTVVKLPMMSRRGEYKYVKTCETGAWNVLDWTDFECTYNVQPDVLEVPLGNSSLSMIFIVSNQDYTIDQLSENMSRDLGTWRENTVWSSSEIYLPKFKFKSSIELSEIFARNEFANVKKSLLPSSPQFFHTASISLRENGHIPPSKKLSFMDMLFAHLNFQPVILYRKVRVNRPFVFMIEDRNSGSVAMMGKISDPTMLS